MIDSDEFKNALDEWVTKLCAITGQAPRYVPVEAPDIYPEGGAFFYRLGEGTFSYEGWVCKHPATCTHTTSSDELLYWIIDDLAWRSALEWAEHQPAYREVADPRRLWIPRWQHIMATLSPVWGERTQSQIEDILRSAPYRGDDD